MRHEGERASVGLNLEALPAEPASASAEGALTDPIADRIAAFLDGIGIPVVAGDLPDKTFLPGIRIDRGHLVVDAVRLSHPGDLLHEAGHVAVMTPERRAGRSGDASQNLGEEIAAIAWSYAALTHLGLPPETVFHADGYRGASGWFVETFTAGSAPGLPLLQWMGLTLDAGNAAAQGVAPYPHMIRWLRAS